MYFRIYFEFTVLLNDSSLILLYNTAIIEVW